MNETITAALAGLAGIMLGLLLLVFVILPLLRRWFP